MKNVNKWFAAALVCLAFVVGLEHYRVSRLQSPTHKVLFGATNTDSATPALAPVLATTATPGLQSATDKTRSDNLFTKGLRNISIRVDDFRSGTTSGQMNWRITNPASGNTIRQVATAQDDTHLGIIAVPTGNTSSTSGVLTEFPSGPVLTFRSSSNQDLRAEIVIRIPTLSTGAQRYKFVFGYAASAITVPTDGMRVEYDEANDTHFRLTSCAASTCTSTNGSTTVVATNTWYRLSLTRAAGSGTIAMEVNGVQEASKSDNVPTVDLGLMIGNFKSVGTTDLDVLMDATQEFIGWATSRW